MKPWLKGMVTSLVFVTLCLILWIPIKDKINPEKLPTPVDNLNRLENEGASDFELPDLDGKTVRFSQFKDKIVILNFWATWCAPCVTEFPSMVRMASVLKKDVVLVAVAADERKEDVTAFIDSFKGYAPNIIHLYDPSFKVAESFGTDKLPETYIFKPGQKLARKVASSIDWNTEEVISFLQSLSREHP